MMKDIAPRLHDREYFYKYMPASTAALVLGSGRLRWSSPLLFNDPFDVPRTLAANASSDAIARAVAKLLGEYLDNPPDDLTDFDPKLQQLLGIVKRGIPAELRSEMKHVTDDARSDPQHYSDGLDALRAQWKALIPEMRILCLTESPAHVAMWYHYADNYQGAVLGFRCTEEVDSCFRIAEKIEYVEEKPDVYTDSGIARLLCLNRMAAARLTLRLGTLTKAADWAYEKEWRLVTYADKGDTGHFSDWRFAKVDLAFVYLGPLMSKQSEAELIELSKKYPNVSVLETSIGLDRELHFSPIETIATRDL